MPVRRCAGPSAVPMGLPAKEGTRQGQTSGQAGGPPERAQRQGACWGSRGSHLGETLPKPLKPQTKGSTTMEPTARSPLRPSPGGPLTCLAFSTGRGLVGGAGLSWWEGRSGQDPSSPGFSSCRPPGGAVATTLGPLAHQIQPQTLRLPGSALCHRDGPSASPPLTWPGACRVYTGTGDGGLDIAAGGCRKVAVSLGPRAATSREPRLRSCPHPAEDPRFRPLPEWEEQSPVCAEGAPPCPTAGQGPDLRSLPTALGTRRGAAWQRGRLGLKTAPRRTSQRPRASASILSPAPLVLKPRFASKWRSWWPL